MSWKRCCWAWLMTGSLAASVLPAQDTLPTVADRQVVIETSLGRLVMEVFPDKAPAHVEAFLARINDGYYVGTAFFRAIPFGIIQGGDPLSKDPAKRELYGTGGLFEREAEFNDVSHLAGTVSTVLVPGRNDSGGAQFFICVTDQTQLDGQYTAFGRVVEGLETLQAISQLRTNPDQRLLERVEILTTSMRDRPPPEPIPFADASPEELAQHTVVLTTDLGTIEIELFAQDAPEHCRQFLRFAQLELYQGTTFHRVVPEFVIQGGSLGSRTPPVPAKHTRYVKPLKAEFNQHKHVRGTVSMARGQDEDSAVDSFFIMLADNKNLDGKVHGLRKGHQRTGHDRRDCPGSLARGSPHDSGRHQFHPSPSDGFAPALGDSRLGKRLKHG